MSASGLRYPETDHDHMFEIPPSARFTRGDMFAMREFLAASVTSVFFALMIDDQSRWFHGYCDLGDRSIAIPECAARSSPGNPARFAP